MTFKIYNRVTGNFPFAPFSYVRNNRTVSVHLYKTCNYKRLNERRGGGGMRSESLPISKEAA